MDNVQMNSDLWGVKYDWVGRGEEWSDMWGGSRAQWYGSLYPRVCKFLPCNRVLEIAPGYGRWTAFLLPLCKQYHGFDLSQQCVDGCIERFATVKYATFTKNNGRVLKPCDDQSVDFVFSFDSLVHAAASVIQSYVVEILRVLSDDGVAFIHHSNWLEVRNAAQNLSGRATDVSAELVRCMVERAGGTTILQEKINWSHQECTDCLTLFARRSSLEYRMLHNDQFMLEGNHIQKYMSPWLRSR